jgi:ribosomal protein S12 methylthiotransferase accessory factor
MPDAAGLVFLGGEVVPSQFGLARSSAGTMCVGGMGVSLGDAFQRCVGVGIEYLSQIDDGNEPLID